MKGRIESGPSMSMTILPTTGALPLMMIERSWLSIKASTSISSIPPSNSRYRTWIPVACAGAFAQGIRRERGKR